MMKNVLLFLFFGLGMSSLFAKAALVEQWLEPVTEMRTMDGEWQLKPTDKLPKPPIQVQGEEGSLVLIKLRRTGLVWIPRTSVRLSEELLQLTCQNTSTVKAKDYQNYGMRGDDEPHFKCLAEDKEQK
jgi:hypothetical protein